jgi:putative exosortase-associated protein (TIGR04073 family)
MGISLRTHGTRNASPRAGLLRTARAVVAAVALIATFGTLAPDAALAAPRSRFTPARKFQRGITNTTLGILAIPGQMTVQTRERGAAVGLPLGFAMGLGWFVASELVGVWELLTCPFPFPADYKPILEPEFPWQYFEE